MTPFDYSIQAKEKSYRFCRRMRQKLRGFSTNFGQFWCPRDRVWPKNNPANLFSCKNSSILCFFKRPFAVPCEKIHFDFDFLIFWFWFCFWKMFFPSILAPFLLNLFNKAVFHKSSLQFCFTYYKCNFVFLNRFLASVGKNKTENFLRKFTREQKSKVLVL